MLQLLSENTNFTVTDAELVKDGDHGTAYTLRHILPAERRIIAEKNTSRRANRQTASMQDVVNHIGILEDLVDHAVVDWSGILADGQPAPCTREYKLLLDGFRIEAILERASTMQRKDKA